MHLSLDTDPTSLSSNNIERQDWNDPIPCYGVSSTCGTWLKSSIRKDGSNNIIEDMELLLLGREPIDLSQVRPCLEIALKWSPLFLRIQGLITSL